MSQSKPITMRGADRSRFHVMIKPTGAQCNLDCRYCFYLHKEQLLDQPAAPRMDAAMLELHIRQYIEAQAGESVVFSWQGGEPTLTGMSFFEQVVNLQNKYRRPGQRIENDLQTNGVLLDAEWCAFLKANNFLVGLSIDGPPHLHDVNRLNKGGRPSSEAVMAAAARLREQAVPFNVLCVVNSANSRKPNDVYRFLRDEVRPRMIQFIPAVEPVGFRSVAAGCWDWERLPTVGSPEARPGAPGSVVTEWSVDPDDWGYFLTRVWDEWLRRDYGKVFVDQFENVISQMFGFGAQSCVSDQTCGRALALEYNGDLYSCDHFVYPEHRLGNIKDMHEGDLAHSERQKSFGRAKADTLTQQCRACAHLTLCWGECPRNRFVKTRDGEPGLSYLCPGLKQFYARVRASEKELARRLGRSAAPAA